MAKEEQHDHHGDVDAAHCPLMLLRWAKNP